MDATIPSTNPPPSNRTLPQPLVGSVVLLGSPAKLPALELPPAPPTVPEEPPILEFTPPLPVEPESPPTLLLSPTGASTRRSASRSTAAEGEPRDSAKQRGNNAEHRDCGSYRAIAWFWTTLVKVRLWNGRSSSAIGTVREPLQRRRSFVRRTEGQSVNLRGISNA